MLVEVMRFGREERAACTSLDVAETFTYTDEETGKSYLREHKAVMRAIRELKCSDDFRGEHYSPSDYVDSRGKKQPCIVMDKDGLSLLVMSFNDPKATHFKEAYIRQFNAMESALWGKRIEREKGIAVRQSLTKALQQSNEDTRMHGHAYSNYTSCIYKELFGLTAAQLREKFGIGRKENLRDCFAQEELRAVQSMECLVSGLVDCGWEYAQIKEFIHTNNTRRQIAA